MTVNNFFSSVDGQLELLAQGTLDSTVSSVGALHALRPRLSHFRQLLLEPPEVGVQAREGVGREGSCSGLGPSLLCACSRSLCAQRGAAWPHLWATHGCTW